MDKAGEKATSEHLRQLRQPQRSSKLVMLSICCSLGNAVGGSLVLEREHGGEPVKHMLTWQSQQLPRERDQFRCFAPRCRLEVPSHSDRPRCWLDRVKNSLRRRLHSCRQGEWQGQTDGPYVLAVPARSLWHGWLDRLQDALDQSNGCDRSGGVVRIIKSIVRCSEP